MFHVPDESTNRRIDAETERHRHTRQLMQNSCKTHASSGCRACASVIRYEYDRMTARPDCLLLSYMAWDTSTANQSVQTAFASFAACCAHLNVLLVNVNFNINVEPGQCNFLPLPSTVPRCQTGHLTNQPQHTDARFELCVFCSTATHASHL